MFKVSLNELMLKWNRFYFGVEAGLTQISETNHLLFYLCWLSLVTELNVESIQLIGRL